MLSIRNLVKIYPGPVIALRGIDLDVPKGMFGLLGPNGAGKSTLMKVIAGLLEPSSGEVTLDGVDVLQDWARVHRQLGYLPQDFGFYPNLSGQDMLAYLLDLKGVQAPGGRKALIADLLERVNLSFAAKRKVKAYSGGMRQRLGIAQAIAGDPKLIIVDEPTAGLDPEERHRFYRLLAELAQERSVLLSTHIVEDVAVLCPRFVVISAGRIVAETTPTEAKETLRGHIYEGRASGLAELRERFRITQAVLVEGENRVRIHAPEGAVPEGFRPVEPTLEDAYMTLVALGRNGHGNGSGKSASAGSDHGATAAVGGSGGTTDRDEGDGR